MASANLEDTLRKIPKSIKNQEKKIGGLLENLEKLINEINYNLTYIGVEPIPNIGRQIGQQLETARLEFIKNLKDLDPESTRESLHLYFTLLERLLGTLSVLKERTEILYSLVKSTNNLGELETQRHLYQGIINQFVNRVSLAIQYFITMNHVVCSSLTLPSEKILEMCMYLSKTLSIESIFPQYNYKFGMN